MRSLNLVVPAAVGLGVVSLAVTVWNGIHPTTAAPIEKNRDRILKAYATLPVAFVENRGQADERLRYYAHGQGYAFYLTREEVMLSFSKRPAVVKAAATEEPGH